MKRLLLAVLLLIPVPAIAQALPPQVTLSAALVEEIFREMSMAKLQADAQAATIAKLQAEVQHQPKPAEPVKPK